MAIERSRRRYLVSCTAVATVLAGCGQPGQSGDRSSGSPGTTTDTTGDTGEEGAVTEESGAGPGTDGTPTATPELDLQEANVVDVAVESVGDGQYQFDVTLYHDDDGEDGYANWWQVETLDGEQLGRRELLHAHSTDPFTRSETIEVPDGTTCVVVRGHDQTHGYGGQMMVVAVESGAMRGIQQGNERTSVEASSCPS